MPHKTINVPTVYLYAKRVKMASTVDFTPLQNEEETNTLEDTPSNSNAQRGI